MNKGLTAFCSFIFGATISSVVTWRLLKSKYEQLANEEIESVKKVFIKEKSKMSKENEELNKKVNIKKVDEIVQEQGYDNQSTNYATVYTEKKNKKIENKPCFEVISPDDYGLEEEYDVITLIYLADGVLIDDHDAEVGNIDEKVGADFAEHFGEYGDDDTIYVRNDKYRTYYEIIRDDRVSMDVL